MASGVPSLFLRNAAAEPDKRFADKRRELLHRLEKILAAVILEVS